MRADQLLWQKDKGWSGQTADASAAQLVFFFGARHVLPDPGIYTGLRQIYPGANIVGCSTGGQITSQDVRDDVVTGLALQFDKTDTRLTCEAIADARDSYDVGIKIGHALERADLRSIFMLSDGLQVNASELLSGLIEAVGSHVTITGGLAGDGAEFKETLVSANGSLKSGQVVAVAFYGEHIRIGHGSAGGWDEFGPKRRITQSQFNVLHELDRQPCIDLYRRYLGDEADGLPGAALLFPLLIVDPENPDHKVIRTVLGVDFDKKSMTFAGNIPTGWTAQLMRGHHDSLAESAATAVAEAYKAQSAGAQSAGAQADGAQELSGQTAAILISCIGRRIFMGDNVVDEAIAAQSSLRPDTKMAGFYSYGEICPHGVSGLCELHNQTMTVTTFGEAA